MGPFTRTGMLPGEYDMTVYKNELGVYWSKVGVTAGGAAKLAKITITADPSSTTPIWRIGDWDGSPVELLNGDKVTTTHPSDVRMKPWTPGPYIVGASKPATGFPCYQWKDINGSQEIQFDLTAEQVKARKVRVGITCAYSGARPTIAVNSWKARPPGASNQPDSRSLTVGTYRGNNSMFSFDVPASAFAAGKNTLWISIVSGAGNQGFLSAGYSVDCVDLY